MRVLKIHPHFRQRFAVPMIPLAIGLLGTIGEVNGVSLSAQGALSQREFRNVMLIVLDDVGIEKLDFYNYNTAGVSCDPDYMGGPLAPVPTPSLQALVDTGVVFLRAYGYPTCSSGRAAILTGRHAFRTGMGNVSGATCCGDYALPITERTIPKMLGRRYTCGAFGKFDLAKLTSSEFFPIQQGFDYFAGSMPNDTPDHFNWMLTVTTPSRSDDDAQVNRYSPPVVREKALQWIHQTAEPFFAYVCFNPPHAPYQVPPEETLSPETWGEVIKQNCVAGQKIEDDDPRRFLAYDWMLESVDHEIGELVAGLGPKAASTTILVVGDNGTQDEAIEPPYDDDHGKGSVYEQGVRVPFIVSGSRVQSVGVHEGVVSVVDLWRTIADIAGVAPGPGGDDSESLYGILQNPQATIPRTEVYVQLFNHNGVYDYSQKEFPMVNLRAMVNEELKYIRRSVNGITSEETGFRLTQKLTPDDPLECWPQPVTGIFDGLSAAMTSLESTCCSP